jgi:hypothetical protein
MPSFIGLGFTLFGAWFLFQAFKARREAQSRQQLTEVSAQGHAQPDSAAHAQEVEAAATQRRRNRELQKFASGCAPIVAMGTVLMALGVAAVAVMMYATVDESRRLSIFDIVSLLFFAGAFAFSLLTRTYYSTQALTQDSIPMPPADSHDPSAD